MPSHLRTSALVAAVLLVLGCSKSDRFSHPMIYAPPPIGNIFEDLYGSWRWVESSGGEDDLVRTPETEEITRRWEFLPPRDVVFYENEIVVNQGTFDIVKEIWDEREVPVMEFEVVPDYDPRMAVTFPAPDSLLLTPPCCVIQTQKFVFIEED